MRMDRAAGPSGMNVSSLKKICSSFAKDFDDLCESIASVTRKLCSCYVDPTGISGFVVCR